MLGLLYVFKTNSGRLASSYSYQLVFIELSFVPISVPANMQKMGQREHLLDAL